MSHTHRLILAVAFAAFAAGSAVAAPGKNTPPQAGGPTFEEASKPPKTNNGNNNNNNNNITPPGLVIAAEQQLNLPPQAGNGVPFNAPTQAVPEPETYALMLAGLIGIGMVSRRKAKRD